MRVDQGRRQWVSLILARAIRSRHADNAHLVSAVSRCGQTRDRACSTRDETQLAADQAGRARAWISGVGDRARAPAAGLASDAELIASIGHPAQARYSGAPLMWWHRHLDTVDGFPATRGKGVSARAIGAPPAPSPESARSPTVHGRLPALVRSRHERAAPWACIGDPSGSLTSRVRPAKARTARPGRSTSGRA